MTPKAQETKRIDKLDYIKIKNFCASKDIVNSMKMFSKISKFKLPYDPTILLLGVFPNN